MCIGGKKGTGENSIFYTSHEFQVIPIGKIVEANKAIPIDILKGNIQVLINTVVTKWIAGKNGKQSFLYNIEPLIEFLDKNNEKA